MRVDVMLKSMYRARISEKYNFIFGISYMLNSYNGCTKETRVIYFDENYRNFKYIFHEKFIWCFFLKTNFLWCCSHGRCLFPPSPKLA